MAGLGDGVWKIRGHHTIAHTINMSRYTALHRRIQHTLEAKLFRISIRPGLSGFLSTFTGVLSSNFSKPLLRTLDVNGHHVSTVSYWALQTQSVSHGNVKVQGTGVATVVELLKRLRLLISSTADIASSSEFSELPSSEDSQSESASSDNRPRQNGVEV